MTMVQSVTNEKKPVWPDDDVILFDGVCVFCSHWVRFVVARDAAARFHFTPIQSAYGTRLAQALRIDPDDPDTNALVHGGVAYVKSEGALTVLSQLPGWGWARVLFLVPRFVRDGVYNVVAKNRYRIFGKYDACILPDAGWRARVCRVALVIASQRVRPAWAGPMTGSAKQSRLFPRKDYGLLRRLRSSQ